MKKRVILPFIALAILLLAGCSADFRQDIKTNNSLKETFKVYDSFTVTLSREGSPDVHRFYEPNLAFFDDGEVQSVYTSSGAYSYSNEKYHVDMFTNMPYSEFLSLDKISHPLVSQYVTKSEQVDYSINGNDLTVKIKPCDDYKSYLCKEYEIPERSELLIVYDLHEKNKELKTATLYVNDEVYLTLSVEFNTTRPEKADALLARLNADANQCRTIKIVLDANTAKERAVISRSLKGDSFKIDLPEGYISAYSNPQCTAPYRSKGAEEDALMYLKEGK